MAPRRFCPKFVAKCNQYGGKIDGAQGVPENMLLRAGKLGVCKINIDTDLRLALTTAIREHLFLHPGDFDPRQYLKPARGGHQRHGAAQNQKCPEL